MYWLLFVILTSICPVLLADSAQNLDQLLNTVKQHQSQEKQLYQQRERDFLTKRNQQQALLNQAQAEFLLWQTKNNPLQKQKDNNDKIIQSLKAQLSQDMQAMGDIYSVYTAFSGDFASQMRHSIISSQFPDRQKTLDTLSDSQQLPSIDAMYQLLLKVQQEMTEAGKIQRYLATITETNGEKQNFPITRLGTFSLISQGHLIQYVPETGELLSTQSAAPTPQNGTLSSVMIDPSRGSLLALLDKSPDLKERIDQGGMVGYAIIGVGLFGLLLACYRLIYLAFLLKKVKWQKQNLATPNPANPLGRILQQGLTLEKLQAEDWQVQLSEAVLKEIPALELGQSLIKLLAAIAPLMGLLGTVVGMIVTFQSISLFGSGDPRLMAGGISQALVTTVEGLLVAMPLLLCHNFVSSFSRAIIQILDEQSAGLLARSLAKTSE